MFQLWIMADPYSSKCGKVPIFGSKSLILISYQQNQHVFSSIKRGQESALFVFMRLVYFFVLLSLYPLMLIYYMSSIRPHTRQPIKKKKGIKLHICTELILPLWCSQSSFPVVTLLHSLCASLKEEKFKCSPIHWSHLTNEHEAW